jgi:hypothetical protein
MRILMNPLSWDANVATAARDIARGTMDFFIGQYMWSKWESEFSIVVDGLVCKAKWLSLYFEGWGEAESRSCLLSHNNALTNYRQVSWSRDKRDWGGLNADKYHWSKHWVHNLTISIAIEHLYCQLSYSFQHRYAKCNWTDTIAPHLDQPHWYSWNQFLVNVLGTCKLARRYRPGKIKRIVNVYIGLSQLSANHESVAIAQSSCYSEFFLKRAITDFRSSNLTTLKSILPMTNASISTISSIYPWTGLIRR